MIKDAAATTMNNNHYSQPQQLCDLHIMSSVNPSTAAKKAIRRSFRSRAAAAYYWNPFRLSSSRHTTTDSSSSQDSVQGAPSNSIVMLLNSKKPVSFRSDKGNGNALLSMVRAISSDTVLTTMDGVDLSVAQTEVRSNLRPPTRDDLSMDNDESFVSESVDDDDFDEDSEEELLSVVMIEIDLESRGDHDDDQMSEISNVSDVDTMEEDEYSLNPWMPEPVHVDEMLLPSGEI